MCLFYKVTMISISDVQKEDNTVNFGISNCNSSFVNALRRTILSDVETISFDTTEYQNSDLTVIKNTCLLHNEFLLHRIGLVPINVEDTDNFNVDNYKFILKKENNGNSEIQVTTADFVVKNLETGNNEDTLKFFPANSITGDNILLTILKNNPTGDGEAIHIEGKCSKGSGSMNSRYSPVSCVVFTNKKDKAKAQVAFEEQIKALESEPSSEELKVLARRFDIEESERYFFVDENGEPNAFDFNIETVGVISAGEIFRRSIKKLKERVVNFEKNMALALDSKESNVTIRDSESVMAGYDIEIENESHTLGFLLQTHINKLNEDIFIGYMNPHPLQKKIKIRVNFNDNDINIVKNIFEKTTKYLVDSLDKLLIDSKDL